MKEFFNQRYRLLPIILGYYFLPLLLLAAIGGIYSSPAALWKMTSIGLLIAAVGSLLLFLLFIRWEKGFDLTEEEVFDERSLPNDEFVVSRKLEEAEIRFNESLSHSQGRINYLEAELT